MHMKAQNEETIKKERAILVSSTNLLLVSACLRSHFLTNIFTKSLRSMC